MSRGTKFILGLMLSLIAALLWLGRPVAPKPALPSVAPNPIADLHSDTPISPAPLAVVPAPIITPITDTPLARVLRILQAWDENDDEASRPQRLAELAALLSGTNTLELVQQLPREFMGYAFAVPAVREKLLTDPTAALAWMSQHPNVASPQLSTFLHDWSQTNQAAMSQYLTSLPEGDWKQTVIASAAGQALAQNPVAAIAYARQLNSGPAQTSLLEMATTDWARQNPSDAAQWASQITDETLRDKLTGDVAAGYADQDPVSAIQFATQTLPASPAGDQAFANVVWHWALQDSSAAGDYLAQLPATDARQLAVSDLINVWAGHDPSATLTWIENLPAGPLQLQAAQAMQKTLPASTP